MMQEEFVNLLTEFINYKDVTESLFEKLKDSIKIFNITE
jgi:hypothetical protein